MQTTIEKWNALHAEQEEIKNFLALDTLATQFQAILKQYSAAQEILNNRHVLNNSWVIPQPIDLSTHVCRRALAVGIECALMELEQYLADEQLELQAVVALNQTVSQTRFDFSNGVSLIGAQDVIPSQTAQTISDIGMTGLSSVCAVLIRRVSIPKLMILRCP
ncbi:hypothetical protein DS901_08690 [Loktanella sp. D2R18]|uniref:hypothetical protein n=1 Tax=Rhodobacterales TaxID=204455 RepID=UPI000DEA9697|nr:MULTISPECIES: hypothetical protein [Rhodobacterales]MDO6589844.1 hypothetical protein [Yoonia sp. 1_MG-2023]RBW44457.1 hypothetical protein DS901_08690 [Loktanella sp. D2R18]